MLGPVLTCSVLLQGFGVSVSISKSLSTGDDFAAVGSSGEQDTGAVYIYRRTAKVKTFLQLTKFVLFLLGEKRLNGAPFVCACVNVGQRGVHVLSVGLPSAHCSR